MNKEIFTLIKRSRHVFYLTTGFLLLLTGLTNPLIGQCNDNVILSASLLSTTDATCNNSDGAMQIQFVVGNLANGENCNFRVIYGNGSSPDVPMVGVSGPDTIVYNFTGLPAGIYQNVAVQILNGNQIVDTEVIGNVTISDNSMFLTISIPTPTQQTCVSGDLPGSGNGQIQIGAGGGTANYQFILTNTGNGNMTQSPLIVPGNGYTFTGLGAGTYFVTVIDNDGNGCADTSSMVTIDPIADVSLNLTNQEDPSCINGNVANNGELTVEVQGGSSTYNFDWSPNFSGGDVNNTSTNPFSWNNIPGGSYTLEVTDTETMCDATVTPIVFNIPTDVTINDNATLQNVVDASCPDLDDGAIVVSLAPNSGTITNYNWNPNTGTGGGFNQGLNPGDYDLTVTNSDGCTDVLSDITVGSPPIPSVTINDTDPSFCSANNGEVTFTVSGLPSGTDDKYEIFETGNPTPIVLEPNISNQQYSYSPLEPGNYFVRITSKDDCEVEVSFTINFLNPSLDIDLDNGTSNQATCDGVSDGQIGLDISNSPVTSPTYSYMWNPAVGSGGNPNMNIPAGNYSVTVTDDYGCTGTETFNLPNQYNLEVSAEIVEDPTCLGAENGIVEAEISNPVNTPSNTYTYTWSPNGFVCNDLPVGQVCTNTGLPGGLVSVTVVDENGCTDSDDVTLVPGDNPFEGPDLNIVTPLLDCFGDMDGVVNIDLVGPGTVDADPPFIYEWTQDGSIVKIETTSDYSNEVTGLVADMVELTITDDNGCMAEYSGVIAEPPQISEVQRTIDSVRCFGESSGRIEVNIIGGTGMYTYSWDGGSSMTNVLDNLPEGTYNLTVTDVNDCEAVFQNFEVGQPALPLGFNVPEDLICPGESDGVLAVSDLQGGTPPYSYEWEGGETTSEITDLGEGNYQVTVYDSRMCDEDISAMVVPVTFGTITTLVEPDTTDFDSGSELKITLTSTPEVGEIDLEITRADDFVDALNGRILEEMVQGGMVTVELSLEDGVEDQFRIIDVQVIPYFIEGDRTCPDEPIVFSMKVKNNIPLIVPGFFSPNGDLMNDTWQIQQKSGTDSAEAGSYNIMVLNRQGGTVFQTTSLLEANQWNAMGCPDGTYYYKIEVESSRGNEVVYGTVTIQRGNN